MKIKTFLYNEETSEAIDIAHSSVAAICSKLKIKLKPKKDFVQRMNWGVALAKKNRWGTNPREIKTFGVGVKISYYTWSTGRRELFEYFVSREIVDSDVTNTDTIEKLLPYANSVTITVILNGRQAWRRQAKLKPSLALSSIGNQLQ